MVWSAITQIGFQFSIQLKIGNLLFLVLLLFAEAINVSYISWYTFSSALFNVDW